MKAAVISMGSKSSKMVINAMKNYFDDVDNLNINNIEVNLDSKNPEVLYHGEPLKNYDCIYAKGSFRYSPLLRSLTALLDKKSYMPIRAKAFTDSHDKLLTQLILQQHKIPMPTTYLSSTTTAAKKLLKTVNYPIIMKFPQGTQGKGVLVADSYASASSMLDALTTLRQPFIIQEFIETDGVDTRALVTGDKVVSAMRRISDVGEARANIHAGGKGESIELDEPTKALSIKAAKLIGADICAVDLMESQSGAKVIEINISPGIQGITEITKIDVADRLAKFLFEKAKEFKNIDNQNGANKILEDLGITETQTKDASENESVKDIIAEVNLRGNRILLPDLASKITGFKENDEIIIKAEKDKVTVKRFSV